MAKIQEFVSTALVQNLAKELLNAIGDDVKTANTALFERKTLNFRDIIDNSFPTMLIVDYDNIEKELKLYQDIDTSLKQYISETYKPTAKDYNIAKFSDAEIKMLLRAIRLGIQKFSAKRISYSALQQSLKTIVDQDIGTSTTIVKVRNLFSVPYKLSDTIGNAEVIIFPSFARIGDLLRAPLEIGLSIAQDEADKDLGIDSIGNILAYGHSAAGYVDQETGTTVLNFNSPKLLGIMFDVLQTASDTSTKAPAGKALEAATFFTEDTRQTEIFLQIDKDFSENFVKLFITVGGNIVRFENSLINSRRGSVLEKTEKRGVNKAVLEKLARAFTSAQTVIGSRLSRYILNKKSSPNLLEYINHVITSGIKGTKPSSHKSSKTDSSRDVVKVKKEVVSGIAKGKAKLPKAQKPQTRIPARAAKKGISLARLQIILDSLLVDQVKRNMGSGERRDVLNLRTGRFAESVRIERLSESREGMITAFYTYMKNPYATFSTGGRQQLPRSRDPKLLISKSIREIVQQQVANRLRAVNI